MRTLLLLLLVGCYDADTVRTVERYCAGGWELVEETDYFGSPKKYHRCRGWAEQVVQERKAS